LLLNGGDLFDRYLHTEITAGDHHPIGSVEDPSIRPRALERSILERRKGLYPRAAAAWRTASISSLDSTKDWLMASTPKSFANLSHS